MTDALSALQYPYWLMIAGAILVVLGFIGFAFSQNRTGNSAHREPPAAGAKGK
jgi:hypothetical protein